MKLDEIRFRESETYMGTFHKITIVVSDPTDEKYNTIDYWSISGYSLPELIVQLVGTLEILKSNPDFPDMLKKEEE